jgi:hypothetical protein
VIIIVLSLKKAAAEQCVRYAAIYVQEEGQKKMKKKNVCFFHLCKILRED